MEAVSCLRAKIIIQLKQNRSEFILKSVLSFRIEQMRKMLHGNRFDQIREQTFRSPQVLCLAHHKTTPTET